MQAPSNLNLPPHLQKLVRELPPAQARMLIQQWVDSRNSQQGNGVNPFQVMNTVRQFTGAGQAATGAGQATAGAVQPVAGVGQTAIGAGQATAGAGQAAAGAGQATAGASTAGGGSAAGGMGIGAIGWPAAIIAGATVLDRTGVSSYGRQLKGLAQQDLNAHLRDKGWPEHLVAPLEVADSLLRFKPKKALKAAVKPAKELFKVLGKIF